MNIGIEQTLQGYALNGWYLFPVKKDKTPYTDHGFKDATQTLLGIREYLKRFPSCNWAGFFHGQYIIDVDVKHNGYESLTKLEQKYGILPTTRRHKTGSGGLHIIYKQPTGINIGNTVKMAGYPGIDRRGNGGYIVLPPSKHECGEFYIVLDSSPIVEAPKWLLEIQEDATVTQNTKEIGDIIGDGQRNSTLASLAGSLRHRGLPQSVIESTLLETNKKVCNPPLPDSEVLNIAKSISRYQPKNIFTRNEVKPWICPL